MKHARARHSSTLLASEMALLASEMALIAGGEDASSDLSSTELFDPSTETFSEAIPMARAVSSPIALRVDSRRVLILGGPGNEAAPFGELYDSTLGTFSHAD